MPRAQDKLQDLISTAWQLYAVELTTHGSPALHPSIPLLWFGDLERYRESRPKVITVSYNPSRSEFPNHSPFQRFPAAANLGDKCVNGADVQAYTKSLNDYFKTCPYDWFDAYDLVLGGISSSYYRPETAIDSTALHTDFCTPLATDPTWGKLKGHFQSHKDRLHRDGSRLWRKLVDFLAPDAILASISTSYRDEICGHAKGTPFFETTSEKGNINRVLAYRPFGSDGPVLIWARYVNGPFGAVPIRVKPELGREIKARFLP